VIDETSYLDPYNTAIQELAELINEREKLDIRRDQIDARLITVRRGVVALSRLAEKTPWVEHPEWFPEVGTADVGFTSAIRRALQSDLKRFFSPVQVRDSLKDFGYEIKSDNILPSIHNTLKRLHKAGNADIDDVDGKTCYRWKGPIPQEDKVVGSLQDLSNLVKLMRGGDTPKHPAYGETITEPPPVAPGPFQRRFAQGLKKETDKKKD